MASSFKDCFRGGGSLLAHTSDSGGTYAASSSIPASVGALTPASRVRNNQGSSASVLLSNWTPAAADYAIYFDITHLGTSPTGQIAGVFARLTAGNVGYSFYWGASTFAISKLAANGLSTVLSTASHVINDGVTVRCRAVLAGTSLSLQSQDPVTGIWTDLVTPVTDATYTLAGKTGLYLFGTATDSVGAHLSNYVSLDAAAEDIICAPLNIGGGGGTASIGLRGYNTNWVSVPPTFTISHSGDNVVLVSQSVAALNVASVNITTGTQLGTASFSDGTASGTLVIDAYVTVVVNPYNDAQGGNPSHINQAGIWTHDTISTQDAVVPFQTADYQSGYEDSYPFVFVATCDVVNQLVNIPNGLTMYVSIDAAAPTSVVGDGTDTTIQLLSSSGGLNHLVRLAPPAGTKLSDISLIGAAPAMTSVGVTQAFMESNIAGMQLPSVASPVAVHGAFYIDTAAHGGTHAVRSKMFNFNQGYNGGVLECQTSGSEMDVLTVMPNSLHAQLQQVINGVLPTKAQLVVQWDGAATVGSKKWLPLMKGGASNPNTLRLVNIGDGFAGGGIETVLCALRARTGGTTMNATAINSTFITVASAAGIVAGDWLLLDSGQYAEYVQVGGITSTTVFLNVLGNATQALAKAHPNFQPRVVNLKATAATITPWTSVSYDQTMLVIGDSISEGAVPTTGLYTISQLDPTNQYAYRWALGKKWNVITVAKLGDRSEMACVRVYGGGSITGFVYNPSGGSLAAGDIALYSPSPVDTVVIYLGTNECSASVPAATYQANYQYLLAAANDPSVLKSYANGGRIICLVPFTPLANNTDPGIGGVLNSVGMHVGISGWSTDPTNYGFWIAQAVSASGVNAANFDRCTIITVSDAVLTGTASAVGPDMYDAVHPKEGGHDKMGAALGAQQAFLFSIPLGTRIYAAVTYWS